MPVYSLWTGNYHHLQTLKISDRLSTSSVILDWVTEGRLSILPQREKENIGKMGSDFQQDLDHCKKRNR